MTLVYENILLFIRRLLGKTEIYDKFQEILVEHRIDKQLIVFTFSGTIAAIVAANNHGARLLRKRSELLLLARGMGHVGKHKRSVRRRK